LKTRGHVRKNENVIFQGNTAINRKDLRVCLEIEVLPDEQKEPDLLIYVTGETVFDPGFLCVLSETSASPAVSFAVDFDITQITSLPQSSSSVSSVVDGVYGF